VIAITRNEFIVFTSNIFAILGLRSLYFAVSGVMQLFRFLNVGLAVILAFVG
jgi:tellurite resistance protein TerC